MQSPLEQETTTPGPSIQVRPPLGRRLFHIAAGSSTPVLGIFTSQELMVILLASLSGIALLLELSRFTYPPLNRLLVGWLAPVLKESEGKEVTGATYMIIAALGCFLFFDKGVAVAGLLFLSVGDPVAALVGGRVGGPRLIGKSPWGTLALFAVSAVLAVILWAAAIATPLWALLAGAAIAALVELLPLPLDDNVTVPLISGAAMALMVT